MKRGEIWLAFALGVAVMISAIFVVQTKHENRRLVNELAELRSESDRLDTEWAQLQLEEATLANPGRVEQLARERLSMTQPKEPVTVEAPKP